MTVITKTIIGPLPQIKITDVFLGGAFSDFGLAAASWSSQDEEFRTDPLIRIFPRSTFILSLSLSLQSSLPFFLSLSLSLSLPLSMSLSLDFSLSLSFKVQYANPLESAQGHLLDLFFYAAVLTK